MNAIWQYNRKRFSRPPLNKNIKADVAVIGGGLTGILTADALIAEGKRVVVLDTSVIGSGQTGKTTAKVTSQHGDIYHKLEHSFGSSAAAQYAQANQRALSAYRQLIRMRHIRCDWEDTDACLYSTESSEPLTEEARAQQRAGLDAKYCAKHDLPFSVKGVVRLSGQGQFHPLKFLYALAEDLRIYENTQIRAVESDRIETDSGSVTAEQIIFTCHFPFINWPGGYFLRMHQERSYVLALTGTPKLSAHYFSVDSGGLSLRQAGDYLLLGGGSHRTGENCSDPYESLRRSASLLFPESCEAAHWSAQDCMTLDGIPYIGHFSSATPNWYVATGFGKWGMSSAMVSALLLRDSILGRDAAWGSIFSPLRITPAPSAASFLDEGVHAVRGLSRRLFSNAHSAAQTLPPAHGGVVELDGQKIGLYRSSEGEVWMVDIRCPHLGCQLSWNQAEASWDCPCHGSRFNYRGQPMDGPAQTKLTARRLPKV